MPRSKIPLLCEILRSTQDDNFFIPCSVHGIHLAGLSFLTDACRLAQGRDALLSGRALFEPCELDRPLKTGVRSLS